MSTVDEHVPRSFWPRWRAVTDDTGLQCWGCNRRFWRRGTNPSRWIETLCGEQGCPADAIAEPRARRR